jgi:methyl acetate hydrolase
MDWVGKAVEAISDQSLEVYFRENIFAPLGMTDTGFLISSAQRARVVPMYDRQHDGRGTTCNSCKCYCTTAPSTVLGS